MRFHEPVPLAATVSHRTNSMIRAAGRPLTAFCACELRSPAPFTEDGFRAFNEIYAGTLRRWGVMQGDTNPVARSNVCPEIDPPAEPSFHAFCFTVAAQRAVPTFVVAGSGEAVEGKAQLSRSHRAATAKPRRTRSREKARFVLGEMERRLGAARLRLGRHDRHAGLHGARPAPVPGRRDRAARRGARRPHLALRAPAGARARIRDGLPGDR